jgi:hypothetical protein
MKHPESASSANNNVKEKKKKKKKKKKKIIKKIHNNKHSVHKNTNAPLKLIHCGKTPKKIARKGSCVIPLLNRSLFARAVLHLLMLTRCVGMAL